ncbi:hypothetical protein [Sinisalibacter lacisalsi]|uniref:Lipoprotein n=1 Tax=Sinisalibacter lacisalsi TaxID=1526570 RepID=A0ABQ1QNH6_9RHOB|nr:hypothetical protein [Sinisalibacter lacisalsi]GGD38156.1 hypothetical protein GCM10011358_22440 [Sinisalibacter lacisalsi]
MTRKLVLLALIAPIAVAGCQSTTYDGGAPKLIATNTDRTFGDQPGPRDGQAAVAVTPDGCEAWIVDEGVEGYASTRSDPRSGLPRCSSEIPPGSVIGDHRVSSDFPDYLP